MRRDSKEWMHSQSHLVQWKYEHFHVRLPDTILQNRPVAASTWSLTLLCNYSHCSCMTIGNDFHVCAYNCNWLIQTFVAK